MVNRASCRLWVLGPVIHPPSQAMTSMNLAGALPDLALLSLKWALECLAIT